MDKTISKSDKDVSRCSLSAMAFLLSELVQYTTARCASHEELVSRLMNAGFEVGRRCIELVSYRREKALSHTRAVTMLEVVKQVSTLLWPYLFGRQPDSVERDDTHAGTFYLLEDVPKFTKFMAEPIKAAPGSSPLNTPGYFVAGIVKGYLQSAGFDADVDAAWKIQSGEPSKRSVTIIKFSKDTMAREQRLQR